MDFLRIAMELITGLFILAVVLAGLAIVVMYYHDTHQTKQTIRRNFPVLGRFRYVFEGMGEFFRQYFFAQDREEMPFNRAERSWVYRAAKNIDSTVAFGSSQNLSSTGSVIFANCIFPTLVEDATPVSELTIGPYCKQPYVTNSLFNVSAMSYGALSAAAIRALSKGTARAGCWLNTGEGGLSPHHLEGGGDIVFQIGTAKYGVRTLDGKLSEDKLRDVAAHEQVKMFELKMSQGAKPGKGGILPAVKVSEEIAAIRGIPVGEASISPNGHRDINSIEDLLDVLNHIRDVTGKPVGFKSVIGAYGWLDELFELINQRGIESAPDFITIDSGDGGTGAAPQSLMDHVGLQLKHSLPIVVDKLVEYGLRERVKVIASGKLINPAGVAWALCIGADFVNSARGFMFSLGCVQAMQCNKNTCPAGVTTHDPELQRGLVPADKAERVYHYAKNMMYEVGTIAHSCGVAEPRQLRRYHANLVTDTGNAVPLNIIHPDAQPRAEAPKISAA